MLASAAQRTAPTTRCVPGLTDGLVVDAAFVDGSHIFHNVFVDLFFLRELVHPGGLVILDDCNWPAVATDARYFEVNAGWELEQTGQRTRLPITEPKDRTPVR